MSSDSKKQNEFSQSHSGRHSRLEQRRPEKLGFVLSGGGARGAYQAGVLKGLVELVEETPGSLPLSVYTGISAGAINACYLAAFAENPVEASRRLADMWSNITSEQVIRTDPFSLTRMGLRWLRDASLGGMTKINKARSLLDTSPLRQLIRSHIPFDKIAENLRRGHFESLSISAMNYTTSTSIAFVQSQKKVEMWDRSRRKSQEDLITEDHVMASAAIPLFFPPVKVGGDHYGDGCLRNTAPVSPAIHMGATRLVVVSVRRPDSAMPMNQEPTYEPSLARILGVVLNAVLLDAIELDMERLGRINTTLQHVPSQTRQDLMLRPVESFWLRPSQDIGHLAGGKFDSLPPMLKYLISGLGSSKEASELTSYLLFEPEYCAKLVEIGYQDVQAQREHLIDFIRPIQSE